MKLLTKLISVFFIIIYSSSSAQILQLVKDVNGAQSSYSWAFTPTTDKLFFFAEDAVNGQKLWVTTDGTPANTTMIGPSGPNNSSVREMFAYNNKVYFSYDDGVHGQELWVSDGTAIGTFLFQDINVGAAGSFPKGLTVANNKLFFLADDGLGINKLYVSNGTPGDASVLKSNGSLLNGQTNFPVMNNKIYFRSDDGFWNSDGTIGGSTLLSATINAGSTGCNYAILNNKLYFSASDANAVELWATDGTAMGTYMVKNIHPTNNSNPQNLISFNNKIYFTANDGTNGAELWMTDGTDMGTEMVKDILPGNSSGLPTSSIVFNGSLYFLAVNSQQLWKSDGSSAGTELVATLEYQFAGIAATFLSKMYIMQQGVANSILLESDGTTAGTKRMKVDNSNSLIGFYAQFPSDKYFVNWKSALYFAASCNLITTNNDPVRLLSATAPVDYIYFNASLKNQFIELKWKVENQVNNLRFEIEKNEAGIFKKVGEVDASKKSVEEYSWRDNYPATGNNTYRLKQIDVDGTATYSKTVNVDFKSLHDLIIGPNPTNNYLNIINAISFSQAEIIDISGRLIWKQNINQSATINVASFSKGIYFIKLTGNKVKTIRFVKS